MIVIKKNLETEIIVNRVTRRLLGLIFWNIMTSRSKIYFFHFLARPTAIAIWPTSIFFSMTAVFFSPILFPFIPAILNALTLSSHTRAGWGEHDSRKEGRESGSNTGDANCKTHVFLTYGRE